MITKKKNLKCNIRIGETVKLGYVDQSRTALRGERQCGKKSPMG